MNAITPVLPLVRLKTERRSNHPWIFHTMVAKPDPKPRPGSVVDIEDRTGEWVGRGFYNGHSRIALRVLTERFDENIDADVCGGRMARAVERGGGSVKVDEVTKAYGVSEEEGEDDRGVMGDGEAERRVGEEYRPAARSATEMPDWAGVSGVQVTDRKPASLWISRS